MSANHFSRRKFIQSLMALGMQLHSVLLFLSFIAIAGCNTDKESSNNVYVNRLIGTGTNGCVAPVASVPFGMVQLGADTHDYSSGYNYRNDALLGFSHVHKSGAGCGDFLDILFLPLAPDFTPSSLNTLQSKQFNASFSHDKEETAPGYYGVKLYQDQLKVELTATSRCGIQRYTPRTPMENHVLVDLKYGSTGACTIVPTEDFDTVFVSGFEVIDEYTIRGYRLTHGFAPEQHVYFYTHFSRPISDFVLFLDDKRVANTKSLQGLNIKAILSFGKSDLPMEVKTGISAVDMEGAEKNYQEEAKDNDFAALRKKADDSWTKVLGNISIETKNPKIRELFYTGLHNMMMYPMLFSDVDYRFRGPDRKIHQTNGFDYYGAVVGLWDTFRAACPLQAVLEPKVTGDYLNTLLEHYKYAGQLPIWTLAGVETYQMIGLQSMPMITNSYLNGIKNFDTQFALNAMVKSANVDTCGFSMGYFVGLKNYKKYGYVPCDLEMESVARTLEYAYDDWAIARFAQLLGDNNTYKEFAQRAMNYKNVIDPSLGVARGRLADGSWRTPFNPLQSEHRRDDFCEGNSWQWTFFVPHDIAGLGDCMGGEEQFKAQINSLFTLPSQITGTSASGDITGLIGQYAHGNEPGHHTIYMHNSIGQLHKTQFYANKVLTTLYDTTPDGICGNEDTGQMSAWYVFSSMGFYPMDPVSGRYELGAPILDKATMHLPSGKNFTVIAENLSDSNIYSKEIYLNGKLLDRTYITFDEVLQGGELKFMMTSIQ